MPETQQTNDLSGTLIDGRYQLVELIGRGGMGSVYKAKQGNLDRIVAVKILNQDLAATPDKLARFQREARVASQLEHPNLVSTYAFGVDKDRPYLVIQYIDGETLESVLQKQGQLSAAEIKSIFIQLCNALNAVHEQKIVHRDLKPSNIFLEKHGDSWKAFLADFGIAKSFEESTQNEQKLTSSGAIIGTPKFMSPEQCERKRLDQRSDIYSLAAVMYRCLLGRLPFEGDNELAMMHKHVHETASISKTERAKIGNDCAELLLKCLRKNPAKRLQSVEAFKDALEALNFDDTVLLASNSGSGLRRKQVYFSIVAISITLVLAFALLNKFLEQSKASKVRIADVNISTPQSVPKFKSAMRSIEDVDQEIRVCDSLFESQKYKETEDKVNLLEPIIKKHLKVEKAPEEAESLGWLLVRCKLLESDILVKTKKPDAAKRILKEIKSKIATFKQDAPTPRMSYFYQMLELSKGKDEFEKACKDCFDCQEKFGFDEHTVLEGYRKILDIAKEMKHLVEAKRLVNQAWGAHSTKHPLSDMGIGKTTKVFCQAIVLQKRLDKHNHDFERKLEWLVSSNKGEQRMATELQFQSNKAIENKDYDLAEYFQKQCLSSEPANDSEAQKHINSIKQRLAEIYILEKKYDKGNALVHEIWKDDLNGHLSAIPDSSIMSLARTFQLTKNYAQAESVWIETLKRPLLTTEENAICLQWLGDSYLAQTDYDKAIHYLKKSLVKRQSFEPSSIPMLGIYHSLADCYSATKRVDDAKQCAKSYASILENSFNSNQALLLNLHRIWEEISFANGSPSEAEKEYRYVLELSRIGQKLGQGEMPSESLLKEEHDRYEKQMKQTCP